MTWERVLSLVVAFVEIVGGGFVALVGLMAAYMSTTIREAAGYGFHVDLEALVVAVCATIGVVIPGFVLRSRHRWRWRLQVVPLLFVIAFVWNRTRY